MDKPLNKIINMIRNLNEEPTMSMSAGKIAGSPEAGDHPPVDKRKRRKKGQTVYLGKLSRTPWLRSVKKNGKS